MQQTLHFTSFKQQIDHISIPEKFTFPFYYQPHPLSVMASEELQKYLSSQVDFKHDFNRIGKMFGVLVVKNQLGELGYLSAFSGKLANSNHHHQFVPPVFDMLTKDSYFLTVEVDLNQINDQIEILENTADYILLNEKINQLKNTSITEIENARLDIIENRKKRKAARKTAIDSLKGIELENCLQHLNKQSVLAKNAFKKLQIDWGHQISSDQSKLNVFKQQIDDLKTERKQKSNALQQYLFNQYAFLNIEKKSKNVLDIFKNTLTKTPPAAAGECAAPKLLQYAFLHDLKPICMAEFWWGNPPNTEIRKHKQYYPACQSKCKPILTHMLSGLAIDENPLLKNPADGKLIETVYEDEYLLVIHKPEEFLSVPGKNIKDSVATRMKEKYPDATEPLVVHRLDMSTSGLMLIAKSQAIYHQLQQQFIKRSIKKRYVALLDGILKDTNGTVELPLRLDIEDRPRQLVCNEHGKPAKTIWKTIYTHDNKTKVYFYPITGRTHQLRVHAAHLKGLNCPIVGDDLYGTKADRLHLHAEQITFIHPVNNKEMTVKIEAPF